MTDPSANALAAIPSGTLSLGNSGRDSPKRVDGRVLQRFIGVSPTSALLSPSRSTEHWPGYL